MRIRSITWLVTLSRHARAADGALVATVAWRGAAVARLHPKIISELFTKRFCYGSVSGVLLATAACDEGVSYACS